MAILQQISVPQISVNDTSLTVVDIAFKHKAQIKTGQILLVFETSKTTYDVVAEADGYIEYLCIAGNDYLVNEIVANIYAGLDEVPEEKNALKKIDKKNFTTSEKIEQSVLTWEGETLFSQAALILIEKYNLNKAQFSGKDFTSAADVEAVMGNHPGTFLSVAEKTLQTKVMLPVDMEKVDIQKLSSNKKIEISYLSSVQASGLTSTIHTLVDTEGIFVHLNQSLNYLKNSLLPVILYEAARLLLKYKPLNAYFTGDAIAYYKEVNLGFAIDIDKGLKVLKIGNTAAKNVNEIEQEIIDLSNKYLDDNLSLNDLMEVGFTVTDLSSEGVALFKPLVNMMNSAILGISSIDQKLNRCMISLTFDHRVTEGKLAAQFLQDLSKRISSYQSKYYPALNQEINCFKCFKLLKEDLSDVGFARCITPKGVEAYICQSCLKGF